MPICPCCSNLLLRYIRHHQVYWFCRSCWQEMPVLPTKLHSGPACLEPDFLPQHFSRLMATT